MNLKLWFAIGMFASAILTTETSAAPLVIADFATDYQNGTTDGDTTATVGLPGTTGGTWNYYEDADGVVGDGSSVLLTYNATSVGGSAPNGDPGYEGSVDLFGVIPLPIVSSFRVFGDPHIATPPPAGFLQVHPGDVVPYLAIEYQADTNLTNLVVEYELAIGSTVNDPGAEGNINYTIVEVVGGIPSTIVGPTTVLDASPTGPKQSLVSDLAAGDSLWLLIDPNGLPFGDATNVRFTLTQVPEPGSMMIVGLAIAVALGVRKRRTA